MLQQSIECLLFISAVFLSILEIIKDCLTYLVVLVLTYLDFALPSPFIDFPLSQFVRNDVHALHLHHVFVEVVHLDVWFLDLQDALTQQSFGFLDELGSDFVGTIDSGHCL